MHTELEGILKEGKGLQVYLYNHVETCLNKAREKDGEAMERSQEVASLRLRMPCRKSIWG